MSKNIYFGDPKWKDPRKIQRTTQGWAIKLYTKDWIGLAGILFFGSHNSHPIIDWNTADHMGIRTMIFRTRQQARDYKKQFCKKMYAPIVVKVRVTIEEVT